MGTTSGHLLSPFICPQTRNCTRTTGSFPNHSPWFIITQKYRADTDVFPSGLSEHQLWGLLTHRWEETMNVREKAQKLRTFSASPSAPRPTQGGLFSKTAYQGLATFCKKRVDNHSSLGGEPDYVLPIHPT